MSDNTPWIEVAEHSGFYIANPSSDPNPWRVITVTIPGYGGQVKLSITQASFLARELARMVHNATRARDGVPPAKKLEGPERDAFVKKMADGRGKKKAQGMEAGGGDALAAPVEDRQPGPKDAP